MFADRRKGFWIEEATPSPSAQIPPHVHRDVWELNWTKRGRGVRTLGGSTEPFDCDDVVLTPPGVRHFWDFRPWRRKFCTHCVFVRTRWIDALRKAIPSLDADLAPLFRAPVSIVARGRLRTRARRAVEELDGLGETEQALGVAKLLLLFARASAESERVWHPATLSYALGSDTLEPRRRDTLASRRPRSDDRRRRILYQIPRRESKGAAKSENGENAKAPTITYALALMHWGLTPWSPLESESINHPS